MPIKIARVQTDDRLLNQLQQNIASVVEPIFLDLAGNFQSSLSGCTTVPVGTVYWQRATSGGPVTLQFPLITATSNTASAYLSGLPAGLWPVRQQAVPVRVYENSAVAQAIALIGTDGVIQLQSSISSTVFTTSGTKGIALSCVTYMTV